MFSPGNLRATFDNPEYEKLISYWVGEKYTLRYTGGMVPDVFQVGLHSDWHRFNDHVYPNYRKCYEQEAFPSLSATTTVTLTASGFPTSGSPEPHPLYKLPFFILQAIRIHLSCIESAWE